MSDMRRSPSLVPASSPAAHAIRAAAITRTAPASRPTRNAAAACCCVLAGPRQLERLRNTSGNHGTKRNDTTPMPQTHVVSCSSTRVPTRILHRRQAGAEEGARHAGGPGRGAKGGAPPLFLAITPTTSPITLAPEPASSPSARSSRSTAATAAACAGGWRRGRVLTFAARARARAHTTQIKNCRSACCDVFLKRREKKRNGS